MSEVRVAPPDASAEEAGPQQTNALPAPPDRFAPQVGGPHGIFARAVSFLYKALAITIVELQKLRHDPWDIFTRSVQPILWLVLFGGVFGRLRVLPPDAGVPTYLDFVTPGILSQSVMTIAIFVGIMLIWERDQGPLQKYLVAPMAREAMALGKGVGAGLKGMIQAVAISILALFMGVHLTANPLAWFGVAVFVLLGGNLFATLSLIIASLVRNRERVQGLGQLILMPLFFASNALYPLAIMPDFVAAISTFNPLSYMVDALRALMIVNGPSHFGLGVDFVVLVGANVVLLLVSGRLIGRVVQ